MAQVAQGSAPDIAGKILRILSVLYFQLLCCLNGSVHSIVIKKLKEATELIENSLRETVKAGIKMGDLGGQSSTSDFEEAIAERIGR